ncbi:LINE-1 retrotransposable element ORF2 protein [Bienertia sinuspersici]
MFQLRLKLKAVKQELKELNKLQFSNIHLETEDAHKSLLQVQKELQDNPTNSDLRIKERRVTELYRKKLHCYVQFLQQKARIKWLQEGDDNTALFHRSLRAKRLRSNLYSIFDMQGQQQKDPDSGSKAFLEYYEHLIGSTDEGERQKVLREVVEVGPMLNAAQQDRLMTPFTRAEVKEAIFSMDGSKAPGPDGFNAQFYKDNWDIVSELVTKAVLEFFEKGKLLKEINATFISLIPKTDRPQNVSEFRPIACCNVIYKCITKMICARMKEVLQNIIAENQGAFVHGRYIIHNVMVCQDMVRHYGRKNTSSGCMIKLDLRKAYDTVNWDFLEEMLLALGFPSTFTQWIMSCVSSAKYSLIINGYPYGYASFKRGLRQGDPMSPLLFVVCMEYLSRLLMRMTSETKFKFHPRCKQMKLTHLCFADDLILCSKGDIDSIRMMIKCFQAFSATSGLKANCSKTEVYSCGMPEETVQQITQETGFKKGTLPFRYLGVPICSKKISVGECEQLLEKITARIKIWSSKNISYAGRAQLINAVLLSIHQYWAQVMILPKTILKQVEAICRAFLWTGQWYSSTPGNVKWEAVCKGKKEGGLGFRDTVKWNIAILDKHVWAMAMEKDNLWVKWIHPVYLKNKPLEHYHPTIDSSWYWKKIWEAKIELERVGITTTMLRSWNHYSVKRVYQIMKGEPDQVHWSRNVWDRWSIPKHSFCSWLAIQNRLKTKERLMQHGVLQDDICSLCGGGAETINHLYFECQYTKRVLELVTSWLGLGRTYQDLDSVFKWINRRLSQQKVKKKVWNAAINAIVYCIWQVRNSMIWRNQKQQEDHTAKQIKFLVLSRLNKLRGRKFKPNEESWVDSLYNV